MVSYETEEYLKKNAFGNEEFMKKCESLCKKYNVQEPSEDNIEDFLHFLFGKDWWKKDLMSKLSELYGLYITKDLYVYLVKDGRMKLLVSVPEHYINEDRLFGELESNKEMNLMVKEDK